MSTYSKFGFALGVLPLAFLLACSSEEPPTAPGPLKATAEPAPAGAAIVLRPRLEGSLLSVDVVGRDLPGLSGVALRVEHPSWARFEGRDVDKGWAAETLHHTKRPNDHEIALVDTAKGQNPGHPGGGEAVLATLRFRVDGAPQTGDQGRLHVVPIRSEVRSAQGEVVKVGYADLKFTR